MENDSVLLKQSLNIIIGEIEDTKIKYRDQINAIREIITVDNNIPFQEELEQIIEELSSIESDMSDAVNMI